MESDNTYSFEFSYKHFDGNEYSVLVEVEVEKKTWDNPHTTTDPEGLDECTMITFLEVVDKDGQVRDDIAVPDEVILHNWELEKHIREIELAESENALWENW